MQIYLIKFNRCLILKKIKKKVRGIYAALTILMKIVNTKNWPMWSFYL